MKERDYSIDILKFLAVFLIINSHMDALYVKYGMLATGGAIGDVLFLFASGYTLLLSKRDLSFDNWYKRRINRIYPSVFVCVVMGTLFRRNNELPLLSLWGGRIYCCHHDVLYSNLYHKKIPCKICTTHYSLNGSIVIVCVCLMVSI